jgi:hypothetical protein
MEKREKDDNWNRHTQQPKQNAASHGKASKSRLNAGSPSNQAEASPVPSPAK